MYAAAFAARSEWYMPGNMSEARRWTNKCPQGNGRQLCLVLMKDGRAIGMDQTGSSLNKKRKGVTSWKYREWPIHQPRR